MRREFEIGTWLGYEGERTGRGWGEGVEKGGGHFFSNVWES